MNRRRVPIAAVLAATAACAALATGPLAKSVRGAPAGRAQTVMPSGPDVTAIEHVTVVPMDRERVLPDHTVIVRGSRIVSVAPTASLVPAAGVTRIDGRGRFLIPGLAEMHAHIPPGDATDAAIERVLLLYVANGVTTARGMLGAPRHLAYRERAARGEVVAPTIYTSGPSLNGTSVPTPEAAVEAVRAQKAAGYDFLKIHPGIRREVFDALAAAADGAGIRFAGHVPLDVGLARALEARYATIDHVDGFMEALVPADAPVKAADSRWFGLNLAEHTDLARIPALVAAARQAGVAVVPTQTLFDHGQGEVPPDAMAKWPEMRFVPPAQLVQWVEGKTKALAAGQAGAAPGPRRFLELRRRLIKALHDGGVPLVLGADAPQVWNVPGFATHRELEAMVKAGLTPWQALAMGTRNVAVFFGTLDRTGTVEPGKRADLLLLEGDPLADIRNTARLAGVMLGGRWLPRAEIDARLSALGAS